LIIDVIKGGGVALRQLAVAWLGWRTRRQVEQGATDVAAGGCAGRTRSPVQSTAALEGYLRARWRAAAV